MSKSELFPEPPEPTPAYVDVGDGHSIACWQYGNENGIPVVVLHGGPGQKISQHTTRLLDPEKFHLTLFDQRGCGRSRPVGRLEANTTNHLISDIEYLRNHFGIDKWMVFGGSWGACLGIAYGQAHPDRVLGFVLRAPCLYTQKEMDWYNTGSWADLYPEYHARVLARIPKEDQAHFVTYIYKKLLSDSPEDWLLAASISYEWTALTSTVFPDLEEIFQTATSLESARLALIASFDGQSISVETLPEPIKTNLLSARIGANYMLNGGFLDNPNQLLENASKLASIPAKIIHGRFDRACPLFSSIALSQHWPSMELTILPMSGHSPREPEMQRSLLNAADSMADIIGSKE